MKKIVFVVGAGASMDFGMPSGAGLVDLIRTQLETELKADDGPVLNSSRRSGVKGDYDAAARDLAGNMNVARSIDRFLETRADDPAAAVVGKRAIALALAAAEAQSPLSGSNYAGWDAAQNAMYRSRDTWISNLFAILQEGVSRKNAKDVFREISFITFNYDRNIEAYLSLAFRHALGQSQEEAQQIVRSIPIIHVYGSLGPITGDQGIDYAQSPQSDPAVLDRMAGFLRTFCEKQDDQTISLARDEIVTADLVVFLGFGFDKLNVEALFSQPLRDNQAAIGTALGLSNNETEEVKRQVSASAWLFGSRCADFINSEQLRDRVRDRR